MAVVEKTIDIIGDDAFCNLLISRTIPEGLPVDFYDDVVQRIRTYGLRAMSQMESINFPKVTHIESYALHACSALKRISFPLCKTAEARVFQNCSLLEEVDMPLLQGVTECLFADCYALETINLPSVVSSSGGICMYGCKNLKTVILPRIQTLAYSFFYGCTSLEKLDLPSIKTIDRTVVDRCSSLQTINLGPNIQTINATAFENTPAGMVINLPVAEGEISGAPWGAPDAVINYNVPYSGDVPIPED